MIFYENKIESNIVRVQCSTLVQFKYRKRGVVLVGIFFCILEIIVSKIYLFIYFCIKKKFFICCGL